MIEVPKKLLLAEKEDALHAGDHSLFSLFQKSDYLLSCDGGEPFQKIIYRLSSFEVIEQSLYGHPRYRKHRGSTHDVRGCTNNFALHNYSIRKTGRKIKNGNYFFPKSQFLISACVPLLSLFLNTPPDSCQIRFCNL